MPRFSSTAMDHFQNPRNRRRLEQPDRVGVAGVPGRTRFLVLYLKLEGERVIETSFQSHGCGATIACGSMLTEMIAGRSISVCRSLSVEDLTAALDGMPPDKRHSPAMAIQALHDALEQNRQEDH